MGHVESNGVQKFTPRQLEIFEVPAVPNHSERVAIVEWDAQGDPTGMRGVDQRNSGSEAEQVPSTAAPATARLGAAGGCTASVGRQKYVAERAGFEPAVGYPTLA